MPILMAVGIKTFGIVCRPVEFHAKVCIRRGYKETVICDGRYAGVDSAVRHNIARPGIGDYFSHRLFEPFGEVGLRLVKTGGNFFAFLSEGFLFSWHVQLPYATDAQPVQHAAVGLSAAAKAYDLAGMETFQLFR